MIGSTIGNYRILEKLGEGGMGAVFKGLDLTLEREVAIKMLRSDLTEHPSLIDRFRAEAIALARLNHPHIAMLFNFFRQDDNFFMVLEYVRGRTLGAVIKERGAMDCAEAVTLIEQALDGLAHAHRLNIIHRDLKPGNLMLTEAGMIKITDFGIARMLGTSRMTRTGGVVGTLEYMSPERIRGLEADARSDLYSVGIVLYELLTGHAPFQGNSDYELMRAQVEAPPLPPRAWAPNLPEGVERIILRALQKAPEDRYQSAWEMREALRATGLTPLLRLRVSEPSGERKASDEVTEKLTPSGRRTVPLVGPVADRIMEPAIPALFSQGEKPPAAVQDERPAVAAQDERLAAAAVQDEMHPVAAVQDEMLAAPPAAVPTPEPEAPPMEMGALPTETDAPPEMELEIPPSLAKYVPYLEAARRDAEAELIPPPSLAADAPPELAAGAALEKSPTPSAERPAALYQHEHAASRSATTAPGLIWKYYLGVAAGLAAGLAIVALALFVLLRPGTAQKPATAPTPSPSIDAATGAAPLPSASPTVQAADSPPPTEKAGVGKEAPKPKPGQSAEAREKERRRREILKALQEKDNR